MPTLIQAIMTTYEAIENCKRSGNAEWQARHGQTLRDLYAMLPSGSGVDNGTAVEDISVQRLKLTCDYHHMDDNGSYDGWTSHSIRVTPGWHGVEVAVHGSNRNEVLDYLTELYSTCLSSEVLPSSDGKYHFA